MTSTAATIRQAGLYSLTVDRANPHFTHNIYVYIHVHTMVVELVKAKANFNLQKKGCVHVP